MKYKTFIRTVLSLALCLAVCASLFCIPAFATGNTLVIIGNKVDKSETSAQTKSVVVSGSSGSASNSGSGVASDGTASTQVIVGSRVDDGTGRAEPSGAVVVQPDGTIVSAGKTEQKQENSSGGASNNYADIVEKARKKSGAPLAELDGIDPDGTLNIHLYEDAGDHTATWDWYYIDPQTLTGHNAVGDVINLN